MTPEVITTWAKDLLWSRSFTAVAFGLTIFGLLVELRGVYVTASFGQPFRFSDFLGELKHVVRASLIGFRPEKVGSAALHRALRLKQELSRPAPGGADAEDVRHQQELLHVIAGLGLIVVGIGLQLVGTCMLVFVEVRPH